MALACVARLSQAPFSSMPIHGAARNRALETSWPACLSRAPKRRPSDLSRRTTASVGVPPALVPPMTTMSKPSNAIARGSNPAATALARRAPSRWRRAPLAFAAWVRAFQLGERVDRAELRRLRDRHGRGELPVGLVGPSQGDDQSGGIDPARRSRQREDAEARPEETGRPCLVGRHMRRLVSCDRLVRLYERRKRQGVGGRAAGGEPDLAVGVEQAADQVRRTPADPVRAVAGLKAAVEPDQRVQHLGHGPGDVVRGEVIARHDDPSALAAHATSRAHARTSSTKRSGCSIAAKWPPRGMSVQRTTLYARSAQDLGGAE